MAKILGLTLLGMIAANPALATDYATNPNPTCRLMRNARPGAPYLPEPNHDAASQAMRLGGTTKSSIDHAPEIRRRFAAAFNLLRQIDQDGTVALADLPPDTPRIDLIIDRHLINLVWARSMIGVFYEEGRAPPVDYAEAARFFQKALDTRFIDDRGCVHTEPVAYDVLTHLAGYDAYGIGVPPDRARARALLQQAGSQADNIAYLFEHDALPKNIEGYLGAISNPARLEDQVYAAEHPRAASDPPNLMTWITNPDAAMAAMTAPIETAATWVSAILAALVAAVAGLWLLHWNRARLEQQNSIYRAAFALYDLVTGIIGRVGLVASGLIGCASGLWMILQSSFFSFLGPLRFLIIASGGVAFLVGVAKLIEAFRFNLAPKNLSVHGTARPAAETEAQSAARSEPKPSSQRGQTFKD